ncbi:hypothetical protein HK405_005260 [Cladochytrium tenue]|nr:hypothetical protein HK405_005260 [Cladochytrium tenue]
MSPEPDPADPVAETMTTPPHSRPSSYSSHGGGGDAGNSGGGGSEGAFLCVTTSVDVAEVSARAAPSEQDTVAAPSSGEDSTERGPFTVVDKPALTNYSIYSNWQKRAIVITASISAFFSPLNAQIYLPALTVLADEMGVSNSAINLTVTTYMIFQGITPMFIGGFADTGGRRPAYIICFVVYIAANIGLALSRNYASIMVVRCLQSIGSSTTVALSQAVVADIITSAERGEFIGYTMIPTVLAPSVGPVIGGLLSQYLGWRWIFWFLTIAASANFLYLLFFFPETCRVIVGDGSIRPHPFYRTWSTLIRESHHKREPELSKQDSEAERPPPVRLQFPNPIGSLVVFLKPEVCLLLTYGAIVFAGFYTVATGLPSILASRFGFNDIQVGLMYLPMAGGTITAAFFMGPVMDYNYRRHALRLGRAVDKRREANMTGFPIERVRLEVGVPLLALTTVALAAWGWSLEFAPNIAAPCVLLYIMGVGMIGFSNCVNALLIDMFPKKAGAVIASNNLARCLVGAAASAAIVPMIEAMGAGWAYVVVAAFYVAGSPLILILMWKGMQWRAVAAEREKTRAEALKN